MEEKDLEKLELSNLYGDLNEQDLTDSLENFEYKGIPCTLRKLASLNGKFYFNGYIDLIQTEYDLFHKLQSFDAINDYFEDAIPVAGGLTYSDMKMIEVEGYDVEVLILGFDTMGLTTDNKETLKELREFVIKSIKQLVDFVEIQNDLHS